MGGQFEFSESGYNELANRQDRGSFLLNRYLNDHALTLEDLTKWKIETHNDHLEFRSYSHYGHYQYSLLRYYEIQPRYKFVPAMSKVFNSLYGINLLPELSKEIKVVVTEGAADTIAVSERLNVPSVSLLTAGMSKIQETLLSLLDPLFWIDGDKRGDEFSVYLSEHNYKVIQVRNEDPASTIKKYPKIAGDIVKIGLSARVMDKYSRIQIDPLNPKPILTEKKREDDMVYEALDVFV